ncbi:TPA: hypothetical protein HA318_02370 [Candidatus Micrarchaeota archaeon]|nr:hypothetical protein [Candidatus Micrarchaeota archaeon]
MDILARLIFAGKAALNERQLKEQVQQVGYSHFEVHGLLSDHENASNFPKVFSELGVHPASYHLPDSIWSEQDPNKRAVLLGNAFDSAKALGAGKVVVHWSYVSAVGNDPIRALTELKKVIALKERAGYSGKS